MAYKRAYSIKEAAKYLGVSKRTVERELAQGRLKAVKFGSRVVVPRWALEERLQVIA